MKFFLIISFLSCGILFAASPSSNLEGIQVYQKDLSLSEHKQKLAEDAIEATPSAQPK